METPSYTLGVSAFYHDSAAALVRGSDVIAAAQEERFSRIKGDANFPHQAIAYCLSQLPSDTDVSALAYFENPRLKMHRLIKTASNMAPRGATIWPKLLRRLEQQNQELPDLLQGVLSDPEKIHFCTHHRSHAASAFYPSPFKSAAILVADGVGEWSTTTIWRGESEKLEPVYELRFPNSIGLFYSAFTQYCGFKVNSGEYKLMGLAPFGKPRFQNKIRNNLIEIDANGAFTLNMKYFDFHVGLSTINPLFESLFGHPARASGERLTQHFMDIAASVQAVLNDLMSRLGVFALKTTGQSNLCLAGGVGLNCVSNRVIFKSLPARSKLWIQPAAGDAGGAIGAALSVSKHLHNPAQKKPKKYNTYLGPAYSDKEIQSALDRRNMTYERSDTIGEVAEIAAEILADEKILGHFDGPMEFGPRALGNRSILADPRSENMLRRINRQIKFREGWRPFAPAILAEKTSRYFESPIESPYMLFTSNLKPKFRTDKTQAKAREKKVTSPQVLQNLHNSQFSAISHVDYSSRLQTVGDKSDTRLRNILEAFFKKTGCPMVLNTSFNVRGEPIVCTPDDAIDCFLNTHLDALIIGSFVLYKNEQSEEMRLKTGRKRFDAD